MGHVKNYTMGDVLCHVRRRCGMAVLHPMGYDAFGLPAENAAIREGGHPRVVTERNIAAIREQMRRMGWSIDWSRELSTADPDYYRWTQWIFLRLFERGLAYKNDGAGQLVPVVPDGAGQRAGHRRRRASAAAAQVEAKQRWRSGTSASPTTPSGCWTTWRCSRTGPSAC